jgi:uncharacterized protein (TIGR02145 family)
MMEYRKQLLVMSLLLLVDICALNAQVKEKVGDNNTRIDASAVFESESTTQGFLLPRMTKAEMLAITNPAEGLMVYCTTCSVKSIFTYSGTDWLNLVNGLVDSSLSSNGTAVVSSYSSTSATGTLKLGTVVSGVTQTITATVTTTGGTYSISTGAINGVTFAGSGTFPAGGSQDIVLTATGTPTVVGTNNFALNTSPSSSFTRETIDPSSAVASYVSKAAAGTMTLGTAASGVTQTITADVTRVGPYNISTSTSNGITFAGAGTYSVTGNQEVVLTASGTPSGVGTFSYGISGSPTVSFSRNAVYAVPTVTSSTTKIWMDRNLGAAQVATSSTDAASYGDLYQWGRGKDGHQIRGSFTTSTLSNSDQPGSANFIISSSSPFDWRVGQNGNLWQGNGTNNPCPVGFRVPTSAELSTEIERFSAQNATGAFNSALKLPMAGSRSPSNGSLGNVGSFGNYWSSTVSGTNASFWYFTSSDIGMRLEGRAVGFSVRCIKD